jgi:hypothetical protein
MPSNHHHQHKREHDERDGDDEEKYSSSASNFASSHQLLPSCGLQHSLCPADELSMNNSNIATQQQQEKFHAKNSLPNDDESLFNQTSIKQEFEQGLLSDDD